MKTRYKFLYRENGIYYWQSTKQVDSRTEQVYCNVTWFWGQAPDYAQISGKLLLGHVERLAQHRRRTVLPEYRRATRESK